MILVLSPAKTLDFTTPPHVAAFSQPDFLGHSAQLIAILRTLAPQQIAQLMSLSDKLAVLNAGRYADWRPPFGPDNAKQAVLAFDGDVYDGLDACTLDGGDLAFAQAHLRILSGLYKIISFFAKRARGLMARYAITRRLEEPEGLKDFDLDGYTFTPAASEETTWIFRRRLSE